ncbi:MAG: Asp-tRNA(Asn)/Glu-tRNA(Gln) amidotransferase subunit GatC [Chloroflexota bacterium]
MPIDRREVEHIAELAYVGLQPEELDQLTADLCAIIEHVDLLRKLDVSDVPAISSPAPVENVLRADEVTPSWTVEAVLANAPHRVDDSFEVPGVLE